MLKRQLDMNLGFTNPPKTLRLGKTEGGRRRGRQKMRRLDGITDSMDKSLSQLLVIGNW